MKKKVDFDTFNTLFLFLLLIEKLPLSADL